MLGDRYNNNKPKWSLVSWKALEPMVRVLEFGAQKYSKYELFTNSEIEKNINNKICQKLESVKYVPKIKISYVKECASHVIQKIHKDKRIVVNAETIDLLCQKIFYVNRVTKENDYPIEQKRVLKNTNIKNFITPNRKIKKKKKLDPIKEDKIQNLLNNNREDLFLEILLNTGLLKKNTTFWYQEDVQSVKVQKDHTLIMIIQLENLEICFVVNAIKLLDCYKIIMKLLKIFLNISLNIDDISIVTSGRFNWIKGLSWTETCDSLLRHTHAFLEGEDNDPESKLEHTAHIMCNAMFLSYMFLFRKDLDDRHKQDNGNT